MAKSDGGRIIRTFQRRQEIHSALKALARVRDERERLKQAEALAQYGEEIIPILLRYLDTTDPFLRGAVGLVVSFLPRETIAPRLREVVMNPARNDQERMTALMFLERFLDEPIEESVYAQLRDPHAVIVQSLREVVTYQKESPDLLLEYVSQLQEEPVEVALMVLSAMSQFPPEEMYPLLQLLAQDVREEVALAVIEALERNPHPTGLAILDLLAHLADEPIRTRGRRASTKMRMRGVRPADRPDTQWRTLVTPPDIHGSQAFWLLRNRGGRYSLLGLLTNMALGIQFAFYLNDVPDGLVPEQPVGQILPVAMGDDPTQPSEVAWFLEAPVGHVRRWLKRLVMQNYHSAYQLPVSYRHWGAHFWWETAHIPEATLSLPAPRPPSLEEAFFLFRHPVLHQWYMDLPRDPEQERMWVQQGLEYSTLLSAFIEVRDRVPADVWPGLSPPLRALAEWMLLAGEEELAQFAVDGARAMEELSYEENPYAQALVLRGLDMLFTELRRARDHWDE